MGRDSNPERDWGLPSWPSPGLPKLPKGGKSKPQKGAHKKGCAVIALAMFGVPVGILSALVLTSYYLF